MAQIICFTLSNTLWAPIILTLGGLNWGSSAKEKPFSGIPIKLYTTSTSLAKIPSTSTFISEGIILLICVPLGVVTSTFNLYSPSLLISEKLTFPLI